MVERDRKISTKAKVARGVSLVAFAAAAAGCEARGLRDEEGNLFPTQPYTTQPTEIPTAFPEPTSFAEVEPEPTPEALVSYPTSLSVSEIQSLLGGGGALPEGFAQDPDVSVLVATRLTWFRLAGLNVDDASREDYVTASIITWGQGDSFRWDVVPKDRSGKIVGWLQIRDENLESPWRFAETPGWDPNFDPSVDQFRFDLPEKIYPENLFEVILAAGEYKILVELNSEGNPLRWLNVLKQEMRLAIGAEIPPLYSECGPNFERIYPVSGDSKNPVGVDGFPLPTGLHPVIRDRRIGSSGVVWSMARGCLVKAEASKKFFDANEGTLTMAFWDVNGIRHLIPFTIGGAEPEEGRKGLIGVRRGGFHFTVSASELTEALNKLLESETRSKQIDFFFAIADSGDHGKLTDLLERYPEVDDLLFEALRTGEGFPEIPEDYFLLLSQIDTPLPYLPKVEPPSP